MKCIILAAGYATRLYPLTKNQAKPLLEVAGKPILHHLMEQVETIEAVDHVYIVTNQKFTPHFQEWTEHYLSQKPITVVNDQTISNEDRLGAIADIQYVLDAQKITDDILVLAGDNLFTFALTDFVQFYQQVETDCITLQTLDDMEELKETGVVEIDEAGVVIGFEEKPSQPRSNLAAPPFYIYRSTTVPLIKQYLRTGNNPDAPGYFIPWLIQHREVRAFRFDGVCYDIGTLESYQKVQELF
ncbi:nucleotidyltransferase family protein [Gracilibacillus alcaliphilus]|uniref:nucleotidyltransferase family protein n=1 Tax=Gracilibacillus alcaliphilus TaxID=1401441 RepID=UPI001958B3EC|nr:nucleotidyltransferase family protein [Gracilibacillus alcaliphilus]MBM7679695.1 glucose-1-phosphate thymidylyltransferase [Gracilibacillus alcaliphilus]